LPINAPGGIKYSRRTADIEVVVQKSSDGGVFFRDTADAAHLFSEQFYAKRFNLNISVKIFWSNLKNIMISSG
jgi:hypothetical protein